MSPTNHTLSADLKALADMGRDGRAECRGLDADIAAELFDPAPDAPAMIVDTAKRMCARCLILDMCRDRILAVENGDDPGGVWGGMTRDERVAARTAQRGH